MYTPKWTWGRISQVMNGMYSCKAYELITQPGGRQRPRFRYSRNCIGAWLDRAQRLVAGLLLGSRSRTRTLATGERKKRSTGPVR